MNVPVVIVQLPVPAVLTPTPVPVVVNVSRDKATVAAAPVTLMPFVLEVMMQSFIVVVPDNALTTMASEPATPVTVKPSKVTPGMEMVTATPVVGAIMVAPAVLAGVMDVRDVIVAVPKTTFSVYVPGSTIIFVTPVVPITVLIEVL